MNYKQLYLVLGAFVLLAFTAVESQISWRQILPLGEGTVLVGVDENTNELSDLNDLETDPVFLAQSSAQGTIGAANWDASEHLQPGFAPRLLRGSDTNGPGTAAFWHVNNLEYLSRNGSGNITQVGWPYSTNISLNRGPVYRGRFGNTWSRYYRIWTDGNHGEGSGLNADLVDGREAIYFYSPMNEPAYNGPWSVSSTTLSTALEVTCDDLTIGQAGEVTHDISTSSNASITSISDGSVAGQRQVVLNGADSYVLDAIGTHIDISNADATKISGYASTPTAHTLSGFKYWFEQVGGVDRMRYWNTDTDEIETVAALSDLASRPAEAVTLQVVSPTSTVSSTTIYDEGYYRIPDHYDTWELNAVTVAHLQGGAAVDYQIEYTAPGSSVVNVGIGSVPSNATYKTFSPGLILQAGALLKLSTGPFSGVGPSGLTVTYQFESQ